MKRETLLEKLERERPVVGDGAWGTLLIERGLRPGECPEQWNLTRPEVLEEIALSYCEAGAELVTTNTFGGSPIRLASFGLKSRTEEINARAVAILRGVVKDRALVSASVGPTGVLLEPYGEAEERDVQAAFERQIRALIEAAADVVCIETMTDLREAKLAIRAARRLAPRLPIIATMTFDRTPRGYFTVMGVSLEQAAAGLEEAGADVVGANCGHGIEEMIGIARELKRHSTLPIAVQPNAGLPEHREGKIVYPATPESMADRIGELTDAGVSLVGGCCGTTPAHIRAIRARVDAR